MTMLDEERLHEMPRLVPPVLSPPIHDVRLRAARLRRSRTRYRATAAVGLAAVAGLALGLDATGVLGHRGSPTAAANGLSCAGSVQTSPLPVWARAGFSPPDQAIAHVTGSRGDIVGVLFVALHAPPLASQNNKILWVARVAGSGGTADLKIHATLNGSSLAVDRVVNGGPGPSTIDVPKSGCWTFTLTWSGQQEQVAIPYSAG